MQPAPASPSPAEHTPRRVQPVACVLLTVLGVLIGVRWYHDRYGVKPSEHHRDPGQRVDLNRASRNELMQIPGIGPQLAERIVAHRETHGPYQKVEDLDRVNGIGDATLNKLQIWVKVDGQKGEAGQTEPDRLTRKPTPKSENTSVRDGPLNINEASLEEIDRLPGIGPVLAQRLIEERKKRPFANLQDLRRVLGLGPKRIEALRELVTFGQ